MNYADTKNDAGWPYNRSRSIRNGFGYLILAMALAGLLLPTSGEAASWETVKTFAPLIPTSPNPPSWPEDVQLGGVSGIAVNTTGAGGVAPGTFYTIGSSVGDPWHAARYSPEGSFELAWTKFTACGPNSTVPSSCPAYPTGVSGGIDIAVDQTTGNVYVFFVHEQPKLVREYRADGTGPIAEFGELDSSGTVTSSPEKVHGSLLNENIAVDASGNAYIFDEDTSTDFYHRVMVFRPETPGDYEHYVYAGRGSDIAAGFSSATRSPSRPMVDDAGNIYVSGESYIEKYDPAQPATPVCTFNLPAGGISAAAVNPVTGGVFYYTYKPVRTVRQLNPCNGSGNFVENTAESPPFKAVPERGNLEAMALDPGRAFPPAGRTAGVLIAGTPEPCPPIGSCPTAAKGQSSLGYMFAPQVTLGPAVESESVSKVGETSATLNAQVNPRGSQTTYVFEYLSEAAFQANASTDRFAGASVVPVGGAVLGTGQVSLPAAVTVGGLLPATTYRYRVVATNETAPTAPAAGAAEMFRTLEAEGAGPPDGRAYELVSPFQKSGGQVLPAAPNTASCGSECKPGLAATRFPVQVSPSGEGIAYQGQPFSFNEGSPEYDEYVSTRTASGWQTTSMSPPVINNGNELLFEAFGLDSYLTRDVVFATNETLASGAPVGYRNLFGQVVGERLNLNPVLNLTPANRPSSGVGSFRMKYVGASADLSRVFFEANDALTGPSENAPASVAGSASQFNLYEWHAGELALVNVKPGNAVTQPGSAFGAGTALADPSSATPDFSNAISAGGDRAFWSSESGQVYVREGASSTREVPDHVGKFLTASDDGGKVLLSDGTLYDLETGSLTDLTGGSGGFKGVVGQSEDLNSIYFVSSSILTTAANERGELAQSGKNNLYSWQNGAVSFIGTLLQTDDENLGVWHASPVQRAAEASPDGRWLAFNSTAALTGANIIGACKFDPTVQKYVGAVPCEEVYLYDAQSESLTCPSCNPAGSHPLGGSFLRIMKNAQGYLEQPRYLTNGGRLFFDSRDALSANDTNNGVEDLYEFEPSGIGSCAKPDGCVSLISNGRGAFDSNFLAADPAGDNVFFTTRQRLVPRDQDSLIDLYDARVGGGLPADYESLPAECQGEGCQPVTGQILNEPSPASSAVEGEAKQKHKKHKHKKHKHKKHKHKKHKAEGKKAQKKGKASTTHGRGGSE